MIAKALDLLSPSVPQDYGFELADLLTANAPPERLKTYWTAKMEAASEESVTTWLRYGVLLGTLPRCSVEMLEQLLQNKALTPPRITLLLNANQAAYLEASQERSDLAIKCILDGAGPAGPYSRDILARFRFALNPYRYAVCFGAPAPAPLSEVQRHYWAFREDKEMEPPKTAMKPYLEKCAQWLDVSERESRRPSADWASNLDPWDRVVESSRNLFGESLQQYKLATVAAGIHSTVETCKECPDLLDHSRSLCRRTRYARLRAGNHAWWQEQLEEAMSSNDYMFAAMVLRMWRHPYLPN